MNHLLHLTICPTCLLLFLFCFTTPSTAADANRTLCQPMSCGSNTPNISYPFWIMDKQQPYCGFPAFKLTCKGGAPVLSISTRDYYIIDVSYNNNSILVVDGVLHNNNTSCPRPVCNITLQTTPFSINSAYKNNLRFFVDCKEPQEVLGFNRMPCSGSITYVGDNLMVLGQWRKFNSCDYSLVVPSSRKIEANPSGYVEVLRKGFVLDWVAPYCGRCSGSGGTCGYNTTIASFMCMCSDRSHAAQCHSNATSQGSTTSPEQHDDRKWRRKVLIGGCSLFAGFMLGSLCIYLWYRQRKNKMQSTSLKNLFRNSSSQRAAMDEDTELGRYSAHIFSYEELQEATDGFATSNELGDGGFGTVYKGKLRDGRVVAVKRLYENNFKRLDHFINEVSILNLLRHQNLVTLYGCTSRQSRELVLVYEYVPNGTVADHLHGCRAEEKALTWPFRLRIAIETAGALAYLHAIMPQIIHRDVKTNNILLDEDFHVKVADFGLSRLFPPHVSHVSTVPQGTPGYVDPEYHQCYQLTDKSDVYSFGVVLVELFSSMEAVDITRNRHEVNLSNLAISRIQSRRLSELVDPKLGYDSDRKVRKMVEAVAELAFRCLQAEREMRPSMEEVLEVLKVIANSSAEDEIRDDTGRTKTCMKDSLHLSPDSVAAQWVSRSTTPNTSS